MHLKACIFGCHAVFLLSLQKNASNFQIKTDKYQGGMLSEKRGAPPVHSGGGGTPLAEKCDLFMSNPEQVAPGGAARGSPLQVRVGNHKKREVRVKEQVAPDQSRQRKGLWKPQQNLRRLGGSMGDQVVNFSSQDPHPLPL